MSEKAEVAIALAVGLALFIFFTYMALTDKPETDRLPYGTRVETIDTCEYIVIQYPFRSPSIVHKANCPNHGGKP